MRRIEVVPYDPKWKEEFDEAQQFYAKHLKKFDVEIEHVGSTSVEGLFAKPVLDIDIIVQSKEESQKVIQALGEVGYEHLGNRGIPGREAFRYDPENTNITWMEHHLYVCIEGCESVRNHLLLRAYLRGNPEAVAAYGNLKMELAKKYPHDIDAYVEAKTSLITSFLSAAGMSEEDLSRITEENKKK
jgi:GrpB-like predicted nucleotidyltransferase (UPF0157 family)